MPKEEKLLISRSTRAVAKIVWTVAIIIIVAIASSLATWGILIMLRPSEGNPIVMGTTFDFTSFEAQHGRLVKAGFEIWMDEVNAKGGLLGRQVTLITYDDEDTTEKIVSNTERLLSVDKVDILLGGWGSLHTPVMAPIAEKYGMTNVGVFWPNTLIYRARDEPETIHHSFAYSSGPYMYPRPMFAFINSLPNETRPSTIALVSRDDIYGRDSAATCKELAEQYNFTIVLDEYFDPTKLDLTLVMTKVAQSNPDVIMGNGFPNDAEVRCRALHEIGFIPKIYWENIGPAWPEWITVLGVKGEYAFQGTPWAYNFPGAANEAFVTKAIMKVGRDLLSYPTAMGYMIGQIYEQAITKADSLDQAKLLNILETNEFDTLMGKVTFTDHFANAPMFLIQVQNATFETIWPSTLQTSPPVLPIPSTWGQ